MMDSHLVPAYRTDPDLSGPMNFAQAGSARHKMDFGRIMGVLIVFSIRLR